MFMSVCCTNIACVFTFTYYVLYGVESELRVRSMFINVCCTNGACACLRTTYSMKSKVSHGGGNWGGDASNLMCICR